MDNIMSLTLPHEQKCVHLYCLHVPVLHYIIRDDIEITITTFKNLIQV